MNGVCKFDPPGLQPPKVRSEFCRVHLFAPDEGVHREESLHCLAPLSAESSLQCPGRPESPECSYTRQKNRSHLCVLALAKVVVSRGLSERGRLPSRF